MNNKILKQIKTSCHFPLLVYKINLKYNEVRKASGISFIVLDVLSHTPSSSERISDMLLKFGIPKDLHYMFANEIAGLLSTNILSSDFGQSYIVQAKYFNEIKINELRLTEKGKKLFKEGAIPTGLEKEKTKDIYFSPITRKFDISSSLPMSPMETSFLGNDFIDNVHIDISGMEDYLHSNREKIGLKSEERIVAFRADDPSRKVVKKEENMEINIYSNNVEFKFQTTDEQFFFNRYFNSQLVTRALLFKNNYKFNKENLPKIRLGQLSNDVVFHLPSEIRKEASKQCELFICSDEFDLEPNINALILDKVVLPLLKKIDSNIVFALFDTNVIKIYCAVELEMNCKNFGDKFNIQMLIEQNLLREQYWNIINEIYKVYNNFDFSDENGKIINYLTNSSKDSNLLKIYAETQLNYLNNNESRVQMLLKFDNVFSRNQYWKSIFDRLTNDVFNEGAESVSVSNIVYKTESLLSLKKIMQMSDKDFIQRVSKKIVGTESDDLVYKALESVGFEIVNILGIVNVIPRYIKGVLENSSISDDNELANKFNATLNNFWQLNSMLGIISTKNYLIKEDYNIDRFFDIYKTLMTQMKQLDQFKKFDELGYRKLEEYFDIYNPIHELHSIERSSSLNPEKITKKYIDDLINRGKYKDAICDLSIKLQYHLRKLFNDKNATVDELINRLNKFKNIDKDKVNILHQLRKTRNSLLHPEHNQKSFNKNTLNTWREIVFNIIMEVENESTSKN